MILAAVAFIAILVIVYMLGRNSSAKAPRETLEQRADRIHAEYEAEQGDLKARHMAAWLPIIEGLPVVDRASAPGLHRPVYDCVSDEYELPCAHSSYESESLSYHMGMPFGPVTKDALRQTLAGFSDRTDNMVALVNAGDCAYLIYTDTIQEPGGKVLQYVRTGSDTYYAYGWRSGMSPGAGKDDPPYFVRDIAARPQVWVERMRALRERWLDNSNYVYAQRQCAHR
jgi:hypothetical protein